MTCDHGWRRLQQEGVQLSRQWQELLELPFFEQASSRGSDPLDRLVAVFVERSHGLFKVLSHRVHVLDDMPDVIALVAWGAVATSSKPAAGGCDCLVAIFVESSHGQGNFG